MNLSQSIKYELTKGDLVYWFDYACQITSSIHRKGEHFYNYFDDIDPQVLEDNLKDFYRTLLRIEEMRNGMLYEKDVNALLNLKYRHLINEGITGKAVSIFSSLSVFIMVTKDRWDTIFGFFNRFGFFAFFKKDDDPLAKKQANFLVNILKPHLGDAASDVVDIVREGVLNNGKGKGYKELDNKLKNIMPSDILNGQHDALVHESVKYALESLVLDENKVKELSNLIDGAGKDNKTKTTNFINDYIKNISEDTLLKGLNSKFMEDKEYLKQVIEYYKTCNENNKPDSSKVKSQQQSDNKQENKQSKLFYLFEDEKPSTANQKNQNNNNNAAKDQKQTNTKQSASPQVTRCRKMSMFARILFSTTVFVQNKIQTLNDIIQGKKVVTLFSVKPVEEVKDENGNFSVFQTVLNFISKIIATILSIIFSAIESFCMFLIKNFYQDYGIDYLKSKKNQELRGKNKKTNNQPNNNQNNNQANSNNNKKTKGNTNKPTNKLMEQSEENDSENNNETKLPGGITFKDLGVVFAAIIGLFIVLFLIARYFNIESLNKVLGLFTKPTFLVLLVISGGGIAFLWKKISSSINEKNDNEEKKLIEGNLYNILYGRRISTKKKFEIYNRYVINESEEFIKFLTRLNRL